jgi:hypothetical protein
LRVLRATAATAATAVAAAAVNAARVAERSSCFVAVTCSACHETVAASRLSRSSSCISIVHAHSVTLTRVRNHVSNHVRRQPDTALAVVVYHSCC